jgi:hypothetical protein
MLPHRTRDTNPARLTIRLEPRRHVHHAAVDIEAIGNHIANVDADAKSDRPIGGLIAIEVGQLLLYVQEEAHRPINTIEHDK